MNRPSFIPPAKPRSHASDEGLPKVSAVILSFNGKDRLAYCIPTLLKQDYPAGKLSIIVVENGSDPATPEFVRKAFPQVTLIVPGDNLGWSGGNNLGVMYALKHLDPAYVFLFNDDTKMDSGFIRSIVDAGEAHPDFGVFGCKGIHMGTNIIQIAGGGWFRKDSPHLTLLGEREEDKGQHDSKIIELDHVYEAAFAVRSEVFRKAGLFDPVWYWTKEGPDFCLRASKAGFKSVYIPQARFEHEVSASGSKKKNKDLRNKLLLRLKLQMAKNRLRFSLKHLGAKTTILYEAKYMEEGLNRLGDFPHLGPFVTFIFGEFYSLGWNLAYLPQTLTLRGKAREDYEHLYQKYLDAIPAPSQQ